MRKANLKGDVFEEIILKGIVVLRARLVLVTWFLQRLHLRFLLFNFLFKVLDDQIPLNYFILVFSNKHERDSHFVSLGVYARQCVLVVLTYILRKHCTCSSRQAEHGILLLDAVVSEAGHDL